VNQMQQSEPLREILGNLADEYAEGNPDVQFDDQPRISTDGETIYVNPEFADMLGIDVSAANEFRLVRNTLNHEVAHELYSDLEAKEEFGARYEDEGYTQVAGTVLNILEDAYIDARRLSEYPGLRQAQAFFAENQMDEDVSEKPTGEALLTSIHQIALGGRVNGIKDADEVVRDFAAWVRPRVVEVRRTHTQDERVALAAEVTDKVTELLDQHGTQEPDLSDLLDALDSMSGGELPDDAEIENAEPLTDEEMPDMDGAAMPDMDAEDMGEGESEQAGGGECDGEGEGDEGDGEGGSGDGDGEEGDGAEGEEGDEGDGSAGDEDGGEYGEGEGDANGGGTPDEEMRDIDSLLDGRNPADLKITE